jgi:pimeloyl-ACP methyl ester carboxylesterase
MGGMLAQVISSRHNSLVRKVILSCTHKGYAIPEGNALIEPFEKRLEERKNLSDQEFGILRVNEMLPELKNKEICNFLATISEEITEGSIKSGGMAMQILDTTKYLSELNQECLIITAVNDVVVSKERSIALENEIPHAETLMLSNVGHAPYCEDALAFNNALEKFL